MANMLGRLGVVLGLDSAEFVMGIDRAGKKLEQFAAKADEYGKYAATAFTVLSIAAIKYADEISEVADANNVAIDTVVKLRSALQDTGGDADKAGIMLSAFTKFIDSAANGSFEAQKTFQALGVSFKDIGTLSQEELLGKALKGLESIEDPITRNAKAMELFSKAAKGVAFDAFAQQMQTTSQATLAQVEAVKAGAETWGNFEKIVRKLQLALVEALGPSLRAINSQMSEEMFPKLTLLNKVLNFIASNAFSAGQAIDALGAALQNMAGRSLIMQTYGESAKGFAEMKKLNDEYFKFLDNQRKAQEQFDRELSGVKQGGSGRGMLGYEAFGKTPISRETTVGVDSKQQAALAKMAKEIKDRQEYHNKLIDENIKKNQELYEKEWSALTKKYTLLEEIQKQQDAADLSLKQQQRMQLNQLDYDRQILLLNTQNKDLKLYELKYAQDILTIRAQHLEQEHQINSNEALGEEYKRQALEQNIVLRDRSIAQAKEVLDIARQESEGSFQKGFGKGFDEFVRNMPNQLEIGKQAFTSLMSSMESALQSFVRTGKFSFKDFARSLIQDMIMIQARAQMLSMIKGLYSMFGGGTPSVDLGYGGGSSGAVGISGFADGGSPPVGRASLVGERGPELFVPRTAGTIIPNNQLANAMGGGQTVNYNGPYIANMSAIDTQSGAQFLAKNKQAVWATYQSANRSIPVTR
jgi:lambda family phage tail tape measure protein